METKKTFRRYLLYFFVALFLMKGVTAYGAEPGLGGVDGNFPQLLPAPNEIEGVWTNEVQALKEGNQIVAYEEVVLGATGKPGLGGADGNFPELLPAPNENEGIPTSMVRK